jgi:hypothetical protein
MGTVITLKERLYISIWALSVLSAVAAVLGEHQNIAETLLKLGLVLIGAIVLAVCAVIAMTLGFIQ